MTGLEIGLALSLSGLLVTAYGWYKADAAYKEVAHILEAILMKEIQAHIVNLKSETSDLQAMAEAIAENEERDKESMH